MPSCSALGPQLLHGHIGSPVPAGPARNVTGEAMPTSLAEALTQLSFLEFVQRCNLLIAPSQPTQLPVPFHSWTSLCRPPHPVKSLRMLPPRRRISLSPRYLLTWQCRRFSTVTVPHPWTLPCRRPTQYSFSGRFYADGFSPSFLFSVDTSVQTPIRCVVQHDAATQLPLTEFFIGCIYSNSPLDRKNPVRQSPPSVQDPHVLPQPPPGLEQPVPPPEHAAYSHLLTNVNSSSSQAQQPPVCTTHVGTHPVPTALSAKRSASTALAGTHNPIGSNLRTDAGLFPKPRAVVLPMVNFGQPKPNRLGPIATVDSDIMHHQFRLSLTVESRSGAQKSYHYCLRCLW